jgi:glycine/D-amino acid oxidase-like deaminating enzyme
MTREFDVAIVGGGIVGCYATLHLAKAGHKVGLFEKGRIAGEQSSRNWGFVRMQGRDPAEIPLMIESRRMWRGLEEEIGEKVDWRQGGNLVLADSKERLAQFEDWLAIAKTFQVDSRMVTPAEAAEIVPGLQTGGVVGGLHTPSDGQAEPEKAAPAIAEAARRAGAHIETGCAVDRIETANGRVTGLETENGPVRAGAVILCTGAWTKHMLRGVGVRMPQLWMRGTVARTSPSTREAMATGVWAGVAFRQRIDGSVNIAGGTQADHDIMTDTLLDGFGFLPLLRMHNRALKLHLGAPFFDFLGVRLSQAALQKALRRHRALDPKPNPKSVAASFQKLKDSLADLGDVHIAKTWAGYIDFTPDFIPVIDRLDRPDGLIVAAGLSGHGFGMGPITGRLAAELATDGRPSLDISAFRLSRYSDGTRIVARNVI